MFKYINVVICCHWLEIYIVCTYRSISAYGGVHPTKSILASCLALYPEFLHKLYFSVK